MQGILNSPIAKLALAAGIIYAAHRWGSPEMRIAALGVAGVIAVNQVPVVRDALTARVAA